MLCRDKVISSLLFLFIAHVRRRSSRHHFMKMDDCDDDEVDLSVLTNLMHMLRYFNMFYTTLFKISYLIF